MNEKSNVLFIKSSTIRYRINKQHLTKNYDTFYSGKYSSDINHWSFVNEQQRIDVWDQIVIKWNAIDERRIKFAVLFDE
jgi:hypothetical protein